MKRKKRADLTFLRKHKQTLLVFLIFFFLTAAVGIKDKSERRQSSSEVSRMAEGEESESQTFFYRVDDGEEQELTVEIHPVERSAEDARDLLDQAVAEWEGQYLGKNKSENEISGPLSLPEQILDGLVTISYESSDYDVLDTDGSIFTDKIPEEGILVELTAEFSYAGYSRIESRWLQVILPEKGSAAWIKDQIQKEVAETEKMSREKRSFSLPTVIDGHRIVWESQETPRWIYFIFLGIAAAFCLEWREKEAKRKACKDRREHLMMEYPQMAEQISLLVGSGMTIRGAWERMLMTDQNVRKSTGTDMRAFIEEMWITYREIQKGCGEREAYERFGVRIGLIPYRRLGAMLSQNVSKGTKDVRELLKEEAREAMEQRKNHARRQGEEASMKLLFPMLLMFVLILIVMLFPAVQSF